MEKKKSKMSKILPSAAVITVGVGSFAATVQAVTKPKLVNDKKTVKNITPAEFAAQKTAKHATRSGMLGDTPAFNIPSTVIDLSLQSIVSTGVYDNFTEPNWGGPFSGDYAIYHVIILKRSSLTFAFSIRDSKQLNAYIADNADDNGNVRLIDLYNYKSGDYGEGSLVFGVCAAMKDGDNFATLVSSRNFRRGPADSEYMGHPEHFPGSLEATALEDLLLVGQDIVPKQKSITWSNNDSTLIYSSNINILENILISKVKGVADIYSVSFVQPIEFNITTIIEGITHEDFAEGIDCPTTPPQQKRIFDDSTKSAVPGTDNYNPIVGSYSLCGFAISDNNPLVSSSNGLATYAYGDKILMYDIRGNLLNNSQEWKTIWNTQLSVRVELLGHINDLWTVVNINNFNDPRNKSETEFVYKHYDGNDGATAKIEMQVDSNGDFSNFLLTCNTAWTSSFTKNWTDTNGLSNLFVRKIPDHRFVITIWDDKLNTPIFQFNLDVLEDGKVGENNTTLPEDYDVRKDNVSWDMNI